MTTCVRGAFCGYTLEITVTAVPAPKAATRSPIRASRPTSKFRGRQRKPCVPPRRDARLPHTLVRKILRIEAWDKRRNDAALFQMRKLRNNAWLAGFYIFSSAAEVFQLRRATGHVPEGEI